MNTNENVTVTGSFRKSLRIFLIGTGLLLGGFLLNIVLTGETNSTPQKSTHVRPVVGEIHSPFTKVAADTRPGVVFIRTESSGAAAESENRERGPFDFFREMVPDDQRRRPQRRRGGGSGFVIDKEGRILTNEHVIRDADKITVILGEDPNEEEFEARVIGVDTHTDIAVIQIDAGSDLPTVPLGDSEEMQVGDWVMAVGTPFGELSGTVTVGVVSAKGRNSLRIFGGEADYQDYIQTDASINFGNSGGPLVNLRGEAIGINTAINPSGQGIGFAIPINMARRISEQLIAKGYVKYGFMGIQLLELTKNLAEGLGLSVERGILVTEVVPESPAEKAGLQKNDVIVEFDGNTVRDGQRFRLMVGNAGVGKKVPVEIVRDGKHKNVNITLTERRPPEEIVASMPTQSTGWLGLEVDDAQASEVRQRYGLEQGQNGVVVVGVKRGSPAGEAGIVEGDVITEVYSRKVDDLEDFVSVSDRLKDRKKTIAFLIKRGRTSTYIPVDPGDE